MDAVDNISDKQLLNFAIENDIIDVGALKEQIAMNERKKYLDMHTNKIWKSDDGKWNTYIEDSSTVSGRRRIRRNDLKSVEDVIVSYYKADHHDITVKELFYEWIDRKMSYGEIQKQTYDRYEVDFNRFFGDWKFANAKVNYITEEDLEDFIRKTIHDMNLSAKGWANLRTLLNGMFKYAKKRGYSNIRMRLFMDELELSKKVFAKKQRNDCDNIFTDRELECVLDYVKNDNSLNGMAVLIAIYTGMRVGEIVALKHEDIFDNYIYVHRTQIKYLGEDGKYVYDIRDCPKTDAGVRKVAISEKLKPILIHLRKYSIDNEYLFYDKSNKKIKTIHCIDSYLYRVCEKVGIPKRSMHVLRKTYATRLLNANVDEAIIINQMGHTEIETTKKYYYYNDKSIKQIAEKINTAINY